MTFDPFVGAESKDWAFFWLSIVVDVGVLATLLPLAIEGWRRLWSRRLRARILHTALTAYLDSAATLKIEPGNLSARALRARIIEAVQASRRRFSDIVPGLLPALDPASQEMVVEANTTFASVLNLLETLAWRAQSGGQRPDTFASGFAADYEAVLRQNLEALRKRAASLNRGKGLSDPFDDSVLNEIFAAGISVDVLWNRVEAADQLRAQRKADMFSDL